MFSERTIAAFGAVVGTVLLGGLVMWRLSGATYRADVETICTAESRSGWTLRGDMPVLTDWVRGHLATPEGNRLFAGLGDLEMAARGEHLRAEAARQGLASCPMVLSYDDLVADGVYRADLQRLCSYVTFPDFAIRDDASRLDALETWFERDASSPRTKALAAPLREASGAPDRARLLRAASSAIDIFTCDIAKVLESPPPSPVLDAGVRAASD